MEKKYYPTLFSPIQIGKGGCGFIIVGATTPDKITGKPTVTCLAADEDPLIPGFAHLAEARMHTILSEHPLQKPFVPNPMEELFLQDSYRAEDA